MTAVVLLLVFCCCCVVLLGGGAAFAYWYFYHYLAPAPSSPPPITPPTPTPPTPQTPPTTPTPPTPQTPPTTPTPPTPQTITPPTLPTTPTPAGPPPPIGNNNLTDDPKLEYTSGTFMQLASIIDPQAVADMNNIRWYDHTPPLVRYDMVKDSGKIIAIVVTDDHPGTLRWLPELVRRILDASVFLYRNLKHEEDKIAWTNDQKRSLLGGAWGFGHGRWPYVVCAIRKPNHDTAAWGMAGHDVILNADLDVDNPEAFQTFFHEIGHVLTGMIIKRHKNWDGTPGTQSCSIGCPGNKEPVCSYCDNALQNIPKFTEAKMYNCHKYKYECNPEAPMEYLAGVFIGYFCENSPQKTTDSYGWEWMNSMFHQKTFRGLVC